jgi:threonine/homoserine/homoserine lactone efflux protein
MDYLWIMINAILFGLVVGFTSSITFGTMQVLCVSRTILDGRRAGFLSGIGVAMCDTIYAAIALFFYTVISPFLEKNMGWLSIVGGLIVIAIGAGIFFSKVSDSTSSRDSASGSVSGWRYVTSAFGVDITTFFTTIPYILTFMTMIGSIMDRGESNMVTLVGFFFGALLWWVFITTLMGGLRHRIPENFKQYINKISGIIIAILGLLVIFGN